MSDSDSDSERTIPQCLAMYTPTSHPNCHNAPALFYIAGERSEGGGYMYRQFKYCQGCRPVDVMVYDYKVVCSRCEDKNTPCKKCRGDVKYQRIDYLFTHCPTCNVYTPVVDGVHMLCKYCNTCAGGSHSHEFEHVAGECISCTHPQSNSVKHKYCVICESCVPKNEAHFHYDSKLRYFEMPTVGNCYTHSRMEKSAAAITAALY